MLIRTKLLLLAGIPLPVLLVLGLAALFNARSQWQGAEQLALGVSLLEAAHDASAAALHRRDAEAAVVTRQSRGLEALLLGEVETAAEAPVTGSAAAEDSARAALAAVPLEPLPPALRDAGRALGAYVDELRARPALPPGATLSEVLNGYTPLLRQVGVLPELLAGDARSGEYARGLRSIAILDRYEDALARERLYVRHAVETNTLTPQLQREFTANQGIAAVERSLLEDVFADDPLRAQLAAALERARGGGRDDVLLQLEGFAERQDKLAVLADALGYGGMIHHYKNFLLRGDPHTRAQFDAQATGAAGVLDELLAGVALSDAERADGRIIADTVADYRRRIERVAQLRAQGVPVTQIDAQVRSRDEAGLGALDRLASFRPSVTAAQWDALSAQLLVDVGAMRAAQQQQVRERVVEERDARRRQLVLLFIAVTATLVLLATFAVTLYRRLTDGIRALVDEFGRVARTGDVETRAVVHGDDELAQLNRSVAAIGRRLQAIADVADAMAAGDLASSLAPLGPQDRLAHAMGQLADSARAVVAQAQAISAGDYATRVEPRSPRDTLAFSLAEMGQALRKFRDDTEEARWLSDAQLRVLGSMSSTDAPEALGQAALGAISELTAAPMGMVHLAEGGGFNVIARMGVANVDVNSRSDGREGLVGRALAARKTEVHAPLPSRYLRLKSGLGEADIGAVSLTPLRARRETVGVLELGWLTPPEPRTATLLDAVAESLGLALVAADARIRTTTLLEETRRQAERLREQQEELRQSNEELEEQAQLLRQSEEALKAQREELQATNEELLEKTSLLQRQREQLEKTARDLALATRYKSEFLANMSHELRTPLNSLLILSKSLVDNEEGNLTAEQLQSARVIHDGGRDLLNLINDILDLSKVEAGRLDVHGQAFEIALLVDGLRRQFEPVARDKKLELPFEIQDGVPAEIVSDRQRVEQILRNLLSNALKFTEKGTVSLRVGHAPQRSGEQGQPFVAFTVEDTGIGIPAEKLDLIFQAFQQADGSTSRRYGGTGLGLTIARQLATLLGGAVRAASTVGQGSRFTLLLPERMPERSPAAAAEPAPNEGEAAPRPPITAAPAPEMLAAIAAGAVAEPGTVAEPAPVEDDRAAVEPGSRSMLVIEDDLRFATIVRDVVRKRGYKCVVANDGASGLRLARKLLPSAILLDLKLPDMDGQRVLDILKWSSTTRHIPVHVVSAMAPTNEPLRQGAIGFLHKPAQLSDLLQVVDRLERTLSSERRRVLVIEDDRGSQAAIRSLLENARTEIVLAATATEALEQLRQGRIDCIVLDLSLPDTDGIAFLEGLRRDGQEHPPVVVYTGRELTPDEHRRLSELAQSIVIKGAASPDRLVDDVLLFLHAVESDLPEPQKQAVARLHGGSDAFRGKKILIVDDDLRNVFALSGLLRKRGLEVIVADNGQMALERLDENPGTDAVLMDIMMPVMDGFEAMRRIRADERFKHLPVIAVTAKAMAEDRRRCMEAGASDYLSKPIELEALLAMLRVWLGRTT